MGKIADEIEERLQENFSGELQADLKRSKIWPVLTGESLIGWQVRRRGPSTHVVENRKDYAAIVNNARTLKGGRVNTNYRAVERWIERRIKLILRRAYGA